MKVKFYLYVNSLINNKIIGLNKLEFTPEKTFSITLKAGELWRITSSDVIFWGRCNDAGNWTSINKIGNNASSVSISSNQNVITINNSNNGTLIERV